MAVGFDQILTDIFAELRRAQELHPKWPEDIVHAAAVVAEEAGELVQAALDHEYKQENIGGMRAEATQVAAMGLRFLMGLEKERESND